MDEIHLGPAGVFERKPTVLNGTSAGAQEVLLEVRLLAPHRIGTLFYAYVISPVIHFSYVESKTR